MVDWGPLVPRGVRLSRRLIAGEFPLSRTALPALMDGVFVGGNSATETPRSSESLGSH